MPMKDPPHPGRSIRITCLDPLGLSITDAARMLGVARHTLSRLLNGHAGVSAEMAIRLEKAGWSNAEFWMRLQAAYDLAQARKREDRIRVDLGLMPARVEERQPVG
ncbi:MAG: HigA family addiction module antitoxin [Gammaproteobacteria bacterium]|nr:HigA family addiction module antitoxin [Gammaproteobacteria bacterium]MDE0474384.1 HigA family addiction module antitoxin [Gammaproteobacteria bacterium]MDE0649875.1 HigA family addiction module antitoxin [Gammaproteobacteria bacterium]MXW08307.1 HigA family addiction module antidote protein [Gammaproteobacteria bacterium]MYC53556.1 HigA family addiction module antidote protein [Gammaproteobacteria bacterium]